MSRFKYFADSQIGTEIEPHRERVLRTGRKAFYVGKTHGCRHDAGLRPCGAWKWLEPAMKCPDCGHLRHDGEVRTPLRCLRSRHSECDARCDHQARSGCEVHALTPTMFLTSGKTTDGRLTDPLVCRRHRQCVMRQLKSNGSFSLQQSMDEIVAMRSPFSKGDARDSQKGMGRQSSCYCSIARYAIGQRWPLRRTNRSRDARHPRCPLPWKWDCVRYHAVSQREGPLSRRSSRPCCPAPSGGLAMSPASIPPAREERASVVLRRALELLGPNGERWIQGRLGDKSACCSVGAIWFSANDVGSEAGARRHLAKVVRAEDIAKWNDAHSRTFPEVKAAFEKAIVLAEQEEGATP
jgi:hypothetical protein